MTQSNAHPGEAARASGAPLTGTGSREPGPQAVLALTGFDPSRVYRSEGYAMITVDEGRDADGAPVREVWSFATEETGSGEGDGFLELRIHEIVETQKSGTLAVYYRQWLAPDGEPPFRQAAEAPRRFARERESAD